MAKAKPGTGNRGENSARGSKHTGAASRAGRGEGGGAKNTSAAAVAGGKEQKKVTAGKRGKSR